MIEDHDYRHPGMGNGTGCAVMVAEGVLCDRSEAEHWTALAEWDKQARRAVEWGIVYENPEAIVALVAKVRELGGAIQPECIVYGCAAPQATLGPCQAHLDESIAEEERRSIEASERIAELEARLINGGAA